MRKLIIATCAFAVAAPLAAQPYPDPREDEIRRALPHPGEVEAAADTVGRVADAIMDVDVAPVVDAIDPRARHRGERTLGDIASRDDPYARERVRDDIAAASVGLGAMVEELAVLTPVLARSLEDAARRMEDAIEHSRARRHGRDHDDRDHRDHDYRD